MLQRIRDRITGWVAGAIIALIAIVFIFWGIDFQAALGSYAARVNGEKIPLATVQRAWQDRLSQLQQSIRGQLPDAVIASQQAALLDEYVRNALLTQRADDLGYRTSDAMLIETLRSFPELQVDGQFSRDRYAALLRAQGRTEPQFEADLRTDLAVSQLRNGIVISGFVTPSEAARRLALQGEEREVDYAVVAAVTSGEQAPEVSQAEIESFYEANQQRFVSPETVTLRYVELTLEDVAQDVDVMEEALQAYYEEVKERFETPERRRARHVLIEAPDGDDATALAKAEEIAAQARAGEDFGELAQKYSQDPGSAEQGGDLGWATRGMFVGPFEEALFAMSPGEVAGPIKTQFGYHVIKLEEIDTGAVRPFADVRSELEDEYRRDQAANLFYERSETLGDAAFTNLDDLGPAAEAVGLTVKTAPGFTREGGEPFGREQQVIDAAFSEDVLEKGLNSPLLVLGDDRVVVLRASDHRLSEQRPLEEVAGQIEDELRASKAQEQAAQRGAAALEALKAGGEWTEVLEEYSLESAGTRFIGRNDTELPPAVVSAAFASARPAPGSTRVYEGTPLANGDFAIVRISDVRAGGSGPDAAAERAQVIQQAAREAGMAEFAAYVTELERTADVERNAAAFE